MEILREAEYSNHQKVPPDVVNYRAPEGSDVEGVQLQVSGVESDVVVNHRPPEIQQRKRSTTLTKL